MTEHNVWTPNEIAWLAKAVGWRGQDAVTATAIALAESSGDAKNYNQQMLKNGKHVVGLWQVYYEQHTDIVKSAKDLEQGPKNGIAAYQVYKNGGGTFNAWTTYTDGSYKKYLPTAQAAVANPQMPSLNKITGNSPFSFASLGGLTISSDGSLGWKSGDTIGVGATTGNVNNVPSSGATRVTGVSSIESFLGALVNKSTWIRTAEILAGVIVLILGIYLTAKGTGVAH